MSPPDQEPSGVLAPPWPRPHTRALLAFGALFLLLVVVFRAVLFPFLMAIYVAYLVEPVIGWGTRGKFLGLRWGRAPVLVVLYTVVLGGLFLLVSCGVNRLSASASKAADDLQAELRKSAPAASVRLSGAAPEAVWVPAGLELEGPDRGRWRTLFDASIGEGKTETRVLLEPASPGPARLEPGDAMRVLDPAALGLPSGLSATAFADRPAKGLELFTERYLIAPVARKIGGATRSHFDPSVLRTFANDQSERYGDDLPRRIPEWGRDLVVRLFLSTYQIVLVLMLTAFIVIDRRRIAGFFRSLPPARYRDDYDTLMRYVDRGLAGVIRGQLLICLVNGLLTWLGLQIFGVPYAVLLGFVAGVFSLIPVFGTIASSIPIVLVALATGGLDSALVALAWIVLIHLLEANVLNPLIMGSAAEMHPVVIVFALLAGEHAFGVWGALLAVPTASLVQSAFKYYRHEVLRIPHEEAPRHGAWMRGLLARWRTRRAPAAPGGGA